MAAPLTDREVLIALTAFRAAMQTCLTMTECGFNPLIFCARAIDDPEAERHVREVLTRDLEMIEKEAARRAAAK